MTDTATDDVQQMLALGISATERGEYASAVRVLRRVYELVPQAAAPLGLSYYGLCIAKVEKKTKAGAELCQNAIEVQSYEGKHWANLVRVYIAGNSRRKAIETLENGLRQLKDDKALIRVRQEIGYRKAPYFRFLRRQNALNKMYSQSMGGLQKRGTTGTLILILICSGVLATIFVILNR